MKKHWKIIIGLVVVILLGGGAYIWHLQQNSSISNSPVNKSASGYSADSDKNGKSTNKNSQSTTNDSASSTSKRELWNSSKSAELASFMSGWEKSMKQVYVSYQPGGAQYDQYGVTFPANLDGSQMPLVVGGQGAPVVSMEWANTGAGKADYQVVAVYGHKRSGDEPDIWTQNLYLFAIHNGSPVVLYTQQNQGGGDNGLHFRPTDNTALESGFDKIVNQ